jgi:hypothetical protein
MESTVPDNAQAVSVTSLLAQIKALFLTEEACFKRKQELLI